MVAPLVTVQVNNTVLDLCNVVQHYFNQLSGIENSYVLNKNVEYYTGVVNLSNNMLSEDEQTVLSNNLKFCPTPPMFDLGELKQDVDRFFRSASLFLWHLKQDHTNNDPTSESDTTTTSDDDNDHPPSNAPFQHPKLKPKSVWTPQFPSPLEHVYQLVLRDIFEFKPKRVAKRNLSDGEYKALNSLKRHRQIKSKLLKF